MDLDFKRASTIHSTNHHFSSLQPSRLHSGSVQFTVDARDSQVIVWL
ncbi:hypothetical protein GLYMA_06G177100v4 [Glycine max]|uniref:Uncharacterized protein n=1 Tax=Glycine max TaxID=3847 RepID=A0A0R0JQD4_SOYBN|nr:hypothetical protein GYH30_015445 [Glycine max]KRH54309.1 hypothetical protein GLYMA_06G177100v4 [Glycine max]